VAARVEAPDWLVEGMRFGEHPAHVSDGIGIETPDGLVEAGRAGFPPYSGAAGRARP